MERAACRLCGLVAPRGVRQIASKRVECNDTEKCKERRLRREMLSAPPMRDAPFIDGSHAINVRRV